YSGKDGEEFVAIFIIQIQWWHEPHNVIIRSINNETKLKPQMNHHLGIGLGEGDAEQESFSSDTRNQWRFEIENSLAQFQALCLHIVKNVFVFNLFENRIRNSAGQRVPTKGGAMIARFEQFTCGPESHHRTNWESAAQAFRQRHH